jgi:hypothetical protein
LGVFGAIFVNGFFKIVKGLLTTSILGEIWVFLEPFCHFGRRIFDVFESIFPKVNFFTSQFGQNRPKSTFAKASFVKIVKSQQFCKTRQKSTFVKVSFVKIVKSQQFCKNRQKSTL